MYIDVSGTHWNSIQEYIDNPDLDKEHVLLYLSMRRRKPQNKWEKELLKEIKEIEAKGRIVEVPFD